MGARADARHEPTVRQSFAVAAISQTVDTERPTPGTAKSRPGGRLFNRGEGAERCYFFDSQNMASMAAISLSRRSATATSPVFLVSPAVLVAFQNMSWRSGNFFRCSGLK